MADLIRYNGDSQVIKRICTLLNTMSGVNFVVVQTLPTTDISTNTIYLVPKQSAEVDNIYDEYINTDGTSQGWELIGTTEIDLSDYYTKTETDDLLDDKADIGDIPTVNNATLTLQKDGTNIPQGTFTANASANKTINIDNTDKVNWVSNGILGAKNLNAYPYLDTTKTQNGVTFTDNGDGTVTVSGKATGGSASFRFHTRSQGETNDFVIKNGTYTFTGCPSGGSNNTYRVNIVSTINGSAYSYGTDTGNGVTFTLNGDDYSADEVNLQLAIDVLNGTNIQTPIVFKPMLRLASDTDDTWQPYSMTNQELTNNKASKEEAEKVKQTNVTSNAVYRVLLSKSATDNEEIDGVNKNYAFRFNPSNGNLYLDRTHTSTSVQEEVIAIGNAKADGTEGANSGIVRLFGKGTYYAQFRDMYNYLTANRNYLFRDATGMLGLYSDVTDFAVMSNLNILDNLIYPIYNHSSGSTGGISYSTNFETGEYTVKGSHTSNVALQIKRYSQGFYLPAGKYKLSGCPSGGSSSKYSLRIYSSTEEGSTTGIGSDYGSGLEFSLTEKTLIQITFYINANNSVDFTFRPKLKRLSEWVELGSISETATNFAKSNYKELKAVFEISYSSYKKYVTVFIDCANIGGSEAYFSCGFDLSGEVSVVAKLILGTPNFSVRTFAVLPTGMSMPSAKLYAKC